jgi:hypothetical protein
MPSAATVILQFSRQVTASPCLSCNSCQYALALWKKLTRFLDYPELELSNNLAVNSMRPVALGRKNWLHIGSPQAGPKVAAILSVVESCRRLQNAGARLLFHDSPRACRSADRVPS